MSRRTPVPSAVRALGRVLVAALGLAALISSIGCGGSVGIEDGTIVGQVFGNASGGPSDATPVAGVTVVAQRNAGDPKVIRTTITDANGRFVLANMPTGEYSLGFDGRRVGFGVIDTAQGATNNRTAVGDQVRVFVEAGATSQAPDVILTAQPAQGDSTVVIRLRDLITGDPVTNATVTVGAATTSAGGANGVYTLSVPVVPTQNNMPPSAQGIIITAEGFNGGQIQPTQIVPIANETVSATVQIQPLQARITGFVQIAQFQTLYSRSNITLTVDSVPVVFSSPGGSGQDVNANGFFTINVPASNDVLTRQFNLNFTAPNLQTQVITNVVAPPSLGTRQLTSPVVMNPITVDLVGTVVDSSGGTPNQLNPTGIPDTVTVVETGQVGNIINGSYTIADVPATDPQVGPMSFTLRASAFNPLASNPGGGMGLQETGDATSVSPVSDGTPNPTFTVTLIQTTGGS